MDFNITELFSTKQMWVGASALIFLFVMAVRNKIIDFIVDKVWAKVKKLFKGSYILNKQQIVKDKHISELLIEIRATTKGDRASIYQFHNGNQFNTKNPIWKLSCTHESVSVGISPELSKCQNVISSSLIGIISCLWDDKIRDAGVMRTAPECCTCDNREKCTLPKGVCLVRTQSMPEGYAKAFLMDQGIKYMLYAPLLDGDNRVGMLAISYCTDVDDVNEIKSFSETVCKYATRVSYVLVQ